MSSIVEYHSIESSTIIGVISSNPKYLGTNLLFGNFDNTKYLVPFKIIKNCNNNIYIALSSEESDLASSDRSKLCNLIGKESKELNSISIGSMLSIEFCQEYILDQEKVYKLINSAIESDIDISSFRLEKVSDGLKLEILLLSTRHIATFDNTVALIKLANLIFNDTSIVASLGAVLSHDELPAICLNIENFETKRVINTVDCMAILVDESKDNCNNVHKYYYNVILKYLNTKKEIA